jgi:hypothetical protein
MGSNKAAMVKKNRGGNKGYLRDVVGGNHVSSHFSDNGGIRA